MVGSTHSLLNRVRSGQGITWSLTEGRRWNVAEVEITKVEDEVKLLKGYIIINEYGTVRRETPKVRGKAAVKAAKRARQAARRG